MNYTTLFFSFGAFTLTFLTSSASLAQTTTPTTSLRVASADSAGAADPAVLGDAHSTKAQTPPPATAPETPTVTGAHASSTDPAAAASAPASDPLEPAVVDTTTAPSSQPPAEVATAPAVEPVGVHDHVTIGGGAIVYLYQPLREGRGNVGVFFANLLLDAQWGAFGLHLEPRFRDTKLRPFSTAQRGYKRPTRRHLLPPSP